jgi:DNA-binding transcriptional LysR family regulator
MDTELLRTFLEVKQTRHFAKAAQNLFVTQAAVSARINQLEGLIGQRLFTRSRNNIQLTVAGHQLVPYAESILAAWSRARMETAFGEEKRSLVAMGCLPSLREIYLDDWFPQLLTSPRNWLLQLETLNTQEMVSGMRESAISIGMIYEPPRASDLWIEKLTTFELLLVSSAPKTDLNTPLPGYIYVDWGSSFAVSHNEALAGIAIPQLKLDSPVLTKKLLLQQGGSAYMASPMIAQELADGRLHKVTNAPVITRTVYLFGRQLPEEDDSIREFSLALHELADSQSSPFSGSFDG